MAMIKMPKKIGGTGASYVDKAGKYHCQVASVDESPTSKKGQAIDGFQVMLSVMHGPELGKHIELTLFNPNPTKEESSQEWSMKKQAAFIIAAGLATERDLAGDDEEKEVEIDLQAAKNRQILIEMEVDKKSSTAERQFVQLAWANIFHVDDPRVAKWEKNVAGINVLPASMRRDPKGFDLEKLGGKKDEASATSATSTASNGSAANGTKPKPAVDLDSI
jgi:hypothetical protein